MGTMFNFNLPNLLAQQRKRKFFTDPTSMMAPDDLSVPSNIPAPGNAMPIGSNQPTGGHPLLANIFNAIASGAAVFGSNNPGETLMQQLSQRRQESMVKQQQQYEREQQTEQRKFQEKMKQTEITAENARQDKTIGAQKESQTSAQRHDVELTSQRFANDKLLQSDHQEAQIKLQQLQNDFTMDRDYNNQDFQTELQQLRDSGDLKQMQIKTVMGALLSSSKYHNAAPISDVMNIVDKMNKGIALTKQDTAAIDKSIKAMGRANAAGAGGGSAQTKFGQKDYLQRQDDRNEVAKQLLIHSNEPMLNPTTGQPMLDVMGKPVMKYASPEELAKRVGEAVKIYDSVTGFQQSHQETVKQGTKQGQSIEQGIANLVKQGTSLGDIETFIADPRIPEEEKKKARAELKKHFRILK